MSKKGAPKETLIKFFGSTSRARILTFFFQNQGVSFYQRQIMFETGVSLQATQRELKNLVGIGIIKKRETANRVYYEVNMQSIFSKPLAEICGRAEIR